MSTMRRSLPALERLEWAIKAKITNLHEPKKKEFKTQIEEINDKAAKEIIKDVESYAVEKYGLRLVLKCESNHSTYRNGQICVGLYFDGVCSPLVAQLKLFLVQEEDKMMEDEKQLERWKMQCLQAMAAGEGFPPIGIAGIEDVSTEQKYYG